MRVGFVLTETVDGRFVPWESFLDWESYIDLYCLALARRGHSCTKYVPSIEATEVKIYRHKFGHIVKRVPVHHPVLYPRWLGRKRKGTHGLTTVAYQLQSLGFTLNLIREAKADRTDLFHYSSYYSSFFVPAFVTRVVAPMLVQYSGGGLPERALPRLAWRSALAPSFAAARSVLLGEYKSELEMLRGQPGAGAAKTRSFDAPIVDTDVFRPVPRDKAVTRSGFEQGATNILSVTFVSKRHSELLAKNPYLLVTLFAKAKKSWARGKLKLYIAGFGPGMDDLREHVEAEGVGGDVKLLGRVKHDSLPVLYSASDLVFVPYPFERLNEGSVTYESFACGTAVAGWRRSEAIPVEQPGGFLVDLQPDSGATQMVARLADSAYMRSKEAQCAELASRVSLEAGGEKLEACYNEAVANRAASRGRGGP